MANETNNPVLLRTVKRPPVMDQKDPAKTGIIFECLVETNCPYCNAVVPLTNSEALSSLPCPACGGKIFVPGRVGGFLLHAHIGEGEMGAIYRATDETLRREVAVKLVRGCHADDPQFRERLLREACAAGKVNHPRVAQVYALNFSNGHPYLVMELVTGQDFAQRMKRDGRIDERTVLRMALDVADGLTALNREGLVHGDIKPGNIVLDRDGNAKLVDFGLSGMTRRDGQGAIVGTPDYIAPELLRGAADSHRSDLYSLGTTLYYLLAGRLPHDGATPADVLKARMVLQPAPLSKYARQVSVPTRKLVMRMLEPIPEKRYPNSEAVAADIREALARLDDVLPETSDAARSAHRFFERLGSCFPRRTHPVAPRSWHLAVGSFLAVVVLVAGGAFLLARHDRFFDRALLGFHRGVASLVKKGLAPAGQPRPPDVARDVTGHVTSAPQPVVPSDSAVSAQELGLPESSLSWNSLNLGEHTQGGSSMQMGGVMIVQGMGTDMWQGNDSCRYVWTRASGDYAFSAHVKVIADNDRLATTGLLIKGPDPAAGPAVLFGALGNGELFLQVRQPDSRTIVVVKRSERPAEFPGYLKIVRRGKTFEALVSADGLAWGPFATCRLDLPDVNSVGFSVSAQVPNTLATAKFAHVRLQSLR